MPKQGGQGKGKPKAGDRNFGVALIRSQINKPNKSNGKSTSILSILDHSSLDDYILTSEMNETNVEVLKNFDIQLVDQKNSNLGKTIQKSFNGQYVFQQLDIPRRPEWNNLMTSDELHRNEQNAFMKWRSNLSNIEESNQNLKLTPFEKNLDVWRQLWRVIEKSMLLIQIVDARNPLFFYSSDLRSYIKEINPNKECIILINKADFLSSYQRQLWCNKLNSLKIPFVFYSAKIEEDLINQNSCSNEMQPIQNSLIELEINENDKSKISSSSKIFNITQSIIATLNVEEVKDDNYSTSEIINKDELLSIVENILSHLPTEKNQNMNQQEKLCFGFIGN